MSKAELERLKLLAQGPRFSDETFLELSREAYKLAGGFSQYAWFYLLSSQIFGWLGALEEPLMGEVDPVLFDLTSGFLEALEGAGRGRSGLVMKGANAMTRAALALRHYEI
jgi:hypothetical protein